MTSYPKYCWTLTLLMVCWCPSSPFALSSHSSAGPLQSLVVIDDITVTSQCIANCTCSSAGPSSIVVDCVGRTFVETNSSAFNEEVDAFLSGRETELTHLMITNSPMQLVPESICRLTRLVHLILASNRLTKLPERCFDKLVALEKLNANNNLLTEIQVATK